MVQIVVSAGKTQFARYFPLAEINTTMANVYRWLGECGVLATNDVRKILVEALSALPAPVEGWVAETPGWYGKSFVLPTDIIASGAHNIINLIDVTTTDKWLRRGTLRRWRTKVAEPLADSPVAVFALCTALAGPVLQLADLASLVFMIVGRNSLGKTTLMEVCGSVWGGGGDESFADTFLRSPEEFEVAALQHRDTLLILDETKLLGNGSLDAAQKFQEIVFRFASEKPKKIFGHQSSNQTLRGVRIFTSNRSAAKFLRDANLAFEGQEAVRLLEIKVTKDFPVFSSGGRDTAESAARVRHLKRRSRKYGGSASRAFLRQLVEDRSNDEAALIKRIKRYTQEGMNLIGLPSHADSMDFRIAMQVAIVYATGRLAHRYGVLPFERRLLAKTFRAVWANIHQQALESVRRDPVREFVGNLGVALEKMVSLDAGISMLTRAEAKETAGFKKTQKDGRLAMYLPNDVFVRLTTAQEPVLRWLEDRGYLQRDGKAKAAGNKTGKRQVKVVVAHTPNGSPIRLRVYKLVGGVTEMRRAAGEAK
jgi:hypothetical protein